MIVRILDISVSRMPSAPRIEQYPPTPAPAPPPPNLEKQANKDADLADDGEDKLREEEERAGRAAEGRGASEGALGDRRIPPIVSHWNLAEYLPASVRQVFLVSASLHKCFSRTPVLLSLFFSSIWW